MKKIKKQPTDIVNNLPDSSFGLKPKNEKSEEEHGYKITAKGKAFDPADDENHERGGIRILVKGGKE